MSEVKIAIIITLTILLFTGTLSAAYYYNHKLKIDNFQATIKDLNNEQKCLHICGFEFPSTAYFDNYKFCVEKCDRISERSLECSK